MFVFLSEGSLENKCDLKSYSLFLFTSVGSVNHGVKDPKLSMFLKETN